MAIDVKTIACPQCGTTDVEMTSETQGICKYCGSKFTVKQNFDTQNVYNEIHIHNGNESAAEKKSCLKAVLIPEYSKDDFLRKAWIELVKEDAPLGVFDQNFGEVTQNDHHVFMESISVNLSYRASIGNDREEPYIGYEDYYETETYYENGQSHTRRVKKQRQVTKYKTVTDWIPQSGNFSTKSVVAVEALSGQTLDTDLFLDSFANISKKSLSKPSDEEAAKMVVDSDAQDAAMAEHRNNIYSALCHSLPGDHVRDLNYSITDITDSESTIYACQEYEAIIAYNDNTYAKHAFPYGSMVIGGDEIENEESLDSITEKMEDSVPDLVWDKTKKVSIITVALLFLSIIVSIFIRSTPLVIVAFLLAVAAFVFDTVFENIKTDSETASVKKEIENYSSSYKIKQREILNNKLKSLGYTPVSSNELQGGQ